MKIIELVSLRCRLEDTAAAANGVRNWLAASQRPLGHADMNLQELLD